MLTHTHPLTEINTVPKWSCKYKATIYMYNCECTHEPYAYKHTYTQKDIDIHVHAARPRVLGGYTIKPGQAIEVAVNDYLL